MQHAQPIRPEDLLEHLSWAKALARRLVNDDATADDVVQESMVAALQHPPAAGRPVRPWLSRVLGNAAKQRARGEGRRAARERGASRSEALPSAFELTSRAEAQRLLIDALLALDEPSREVVLLRYFEGLSSAEIARRNGQPTGTVRSRLKRALDGLREALDDRFEGERGGWHMALVPLTLPRAAAPTSAAAGVLVLGGILMKAAVAIGALAVLALAVVFLGDALRPFAPVPVENVTFVPIAEVEEAATDRPQATTSARRSIAREPSPEAADAGVFVAGDGQVTLRLVDQLGRPIEGVAASSRRGSTATSGADGRVTLDVWYGYEGAEGSIRVRRAGIASDVVTVWGAPGERTDLGDVVLHLGGDISGTVVDESGAPLEGLRVFVEGREQHVSTTGGMQMMKISDLGAAEDRSDAAGRFRLSGVFVDSVHVQVESDDDLHRGRSGRVEVRAGQESAGLVVVAREIDPETRIEGIVLDAEGDPAPYVSVSARWRTLFSGGSSASTTDESGFFRIVVPARAKADIDVRAGGSSEARARLEGVRGGTHDLEILLVEPARLVVALTSADGTPTTAASLFVSTADGLVGRPMTAEDGRYVLSAPDGPFRVVAEADGHAETTSLALDPSSLPAVLELTLAPMPTLRGVVTVDGRAAADVSLTVRALATETVRVEGLPSLVDPSPVATGESQTDGGFSLTLREAGRFVLRAELDGHAPAEFGPFDYAPTTGLDGVALVLTRGGALEGVVLDGDDVRQSRVVLVSRGDGLIRTVRTDLDGAYRFEHLTPGAWMVRVVSETIEPEHAAMSASWGRPFRAIDGDCLVREGEVTRFDPMIGRLQARVSVKGRLTFDGFDPSRFAVDLVPLTDGRSAPDEPRVARVDDGGQFLVQGGAPGRYMLVLVDTLEEEDVALRFASRLELTAGENEFTLAVHFGTVRVGEGAERLGERLLWRGPDGAFAIAGLPLAGETRPFPSGTVQRVRFEAIALGDVDAAEAIEQATLDPGGEVELAR